MQPGVRFFLRDITEKLAKKFLANENNSSFSSQRVFKMLLTWNICDVAVSHGHYSRISTVL